MLGEGASPIRAFIYLNKQNSVNTFYVCKNYEKICLAQKEHFNVDTYFKLLKTISFNVLSQYLCFIFENRF